MKLIFSLLLVISFSLTSCSSTNHAQTCEPRSELLQIDQFAARVLEYVPATDTTKSLIIVPPTGGTNYIDKSYASLFCKEGYRVLILDSWDGDIERTFELEIHERFYTKAQKAIGLSIERLKKSSPKSKIGLIGTSVGGLHAIIAASRHDDLNAVFAIVGGISIAEVIATSDQAAMKVLRDERKKIYGFQSDEQHIQAIQKAFSLEPETLGLGFQKKYLGVSIAKGDETVTYKTQENLMNFWKPSVVIKNTGSHFWGIVNTWLWHSSDLLKFFETSQQVKI